MTLSRTLIALALLSGSAACGEAALKYIKFNTVENGKPVEQEKFFLDGFSDDNPKSQAFHLAQRNDIAGAMKILNDEVAKDPDEPWNHYDISILCEATGDWAKAETEMKDAQRLDGVKATKQKVPPEKRFAEELVFIAAHKPK